MKTNLNILKIGSNVIDDDAQLRAFLKNFASLPSPKILVHGGGKIATDFNKKLGNESILIEGRRVTSQAELDTVVMTYAGLINKKIVGLLQQYSCNSIGLSGADGNSIQATKRSPQPIDYGYVGDIQQVNSSFIQLLLDNEITPVFCAISHDGNGQLLNTNADTIASELAIALSSNYATELIYCFEKNGVLSNIEDENSVIETITLADYEQLKTNNIIVSGMLPKIDNCFHALSNHVTKVIIRNADLTSTQAQTQLKLL